MSALLKHDGGCYDGDEEVNYHADDGGGGSDGDDDDGDGDVNILVKKRWL